MSSGTLFLAIVLFVATGLLYWAGTQTMTNPVAADICNNIYAYCRQPNRIGLIAIGALIAHFLVRGVRY